MNLSGRSVCFAAALVAISAAAAPGQTMRERVEPYLRRALAAGNPFVSVAAASGSPTLALGSLGSLFGPNLAAQTGSGSVPYPTTLDGVGLQIVDSAGKSEALRLLYVSPDQINYLIPSDIAPGAATISIMNGAANAPSGTVQVQREAPALFTANGNGQGVVAATAYATAIPTTLATPVTVFQCGAAPGSCVSVPIDPGVDRPVAITLYATGIRARSSDSAVTLTIGGVNVPIRSISSSDDNGPLAGVDEVTFGLPLSLRGLGEVDIFLTADGLESNHGRINIR